jgi:thioredoxin 1
MKRPYVIGGIVPILAEPVANNLTVNQWHNEFPQFGQKGWAAVQRLSFSVSDPLPRFPMSDAIVHVNDANFDNEVLQSATPVLVDYWAEWCGPCKMIAPILEDVARDYSGKLKIAKLNIDDNQATPPKYGIRGIPTLMLFKNGNVEATKVGALSKSQLAAFIDANI